MKFDDVISKRHSVRAFTGKKVKWSDILEAIDAASKIPQAGNQNNMKFLIVEDQKTKNLIAKHAQQAWLSEAEFIVLACSDSTSLERAYDARGTIYSRQQAGAAIENFLLKITDLGLASCWVGAFSDELTKQALSIPEHVNIEALLPVGHEKGKGKQKSKAQLENIIYWEKWNVKKKPTYFKDPKTNEGGRAWTHK